MSSGFKDSSKFYLDHKGKHRFQRDTTTWATVARSHVSLDYYCFTNPDEGLRVTKSQIPDERPLQQPFKLQKHQSKWDPRQDAFEDVSPVKYHPSKSRKVSNPKSFRNTKKPYKLQYLKNSKDRIQFTFELQDHTLHNLFIESRAKSTEKYHFWMTQTALQFESLLQKIKTHLKYSCYIMCHCDFRTSEFKGWLWERLLLLEQERPEIISQIKLWKYKVCFS